MTRGWHEIRFCCFYKVLLCAQVICVTVDLTHNHVKPITFVHLDQNQIGAYLLVFEIIKTHLAHLIMYYKINAHHYLIAHVSQVLWGPTNYKSDAQNKFQSTC